MKKSNANSSASLSTNNLRIQHCQEEVSKPTRKAMGWKRWRCHCYLIRSKSGNIYTYIYNSINIIPKCTCKDLTAHCSNMMSLACLWWPLIPTMPTAWNHKRVCEAYLAECTWRYLNYWNQRLNSVNTWQQGHKPESPWCKPQKTASRAADTVGSPLKN